MKTDRVAIIWHIVLISGVILILFPLIYALSNSFKTLQDAFNNVFSLIPREFTLDNYRHVFARQDFLRITLNTLTIAMAVTFFKLATSVFAAYGLVFFDFKWKNIVYFLLISTMFIPFSVTMIPNYITITSWGLRDKLIGVILPQLADALGIFFMRQSMRGVPNTIIEYAKLEDIGHGKMLKDIIVPMIKPNIISTGIIFFVNSWNEFVWPVLMIRSQDKYTLSLALQMYISSEGGTDFTIAMSVSVITMILPIILFLVFQKQIISTFSTSGLK